MTTYLLIDTNFLLYRAFHAMGSMHHGTIPTGAFFGLLRDIGTLQDRFATDNVIFFFDYGRGIRKDIFPGYKKKRSVENLDAEEKEAKLAMMDQACMVRKVYLKKLGYTNIEYQDGYEADDLIAAFCKQLKEDEDAIIITADQDLYQCLSKKVSFYSPNNQKYISKKRFIKEYGIKPKQWARVKAIAGCSSDEVPGIKGVGEKTAIKYLLGDLKTTHKTFQNICSAKGHKQIQFNKRLVKLPLQGTRSEFEVTPDKLTRKRWDKVMKHLGFETMIGSPCVSLS